MTWEVRHGDCLDGMRALDAGSVDAIVCDPPYGLEFMGKEWDSFRGSNAGIKSSGFEKLGKNGTPSFSANRRNQKCQKCGKWAYDHKGRKCECGGWKHQAQLLYSNGFQQFSYSWAVEALRVAKPGAHLLAFGGTRTFHRLTCAIEDAGWEIRDCLSWLYGSGFPKSHNGPWGGTALKPAWEPVIMARKPLAGTVAANVAAHGTGGLNVDGCRIAGDAGTGNWSGRAVNPSSAFIRHQSELGAAPMNPSGRWPANVCLDEDAAAMLDAQSGERKGGAFPGRTARGPKFTGTTYNGGREYHGAIDADPRPMGDTGGASRFFYCPKASRSEREAGLEGMPVRESWRHNQAGRDATNPANVIGAGAKARMERGEPAVRPTANHHPTVKPIALMRWLCRLVTPSGGLVLDPFTGSGTTGCAAALEGFRFLGFEREAEYVEIARRRIAHVRAGVLPCRHVRAI